MFKHRAHQADDQARIVKLRIPIRHPSRQALRCDIRNRLPCGGRIQHTAGLNAVPTGQHIVKRQTQGKLGLLQS